MSDNFPQENLEDLDFRLKQAREKNHASNKMSNTVGVDQSYGYSMAIRIGTELVAALIVGVGVGYFLDYWLDTKPWFLVTFFFLGAGAGVLNVYRAAIGLGMAPGYKKPSNNVSSLFKRQKNQLKNKHKEKKE